MEKYKLKPLTTEEKEMAANNHNIVYAFLYQHGYSIDNFYGVAVMGFLKGIQVYCRKTRYTKQADMYFTVWQYMRTELENNRKMENALKRKPTETVISLDVEHSEMENLYNCVGGKSVESEYLEKERINELLGKLTEVQRVISKMKMEGFNNTEIFLILDIPSSTYYREINRIKATLEKYIA